MPDFDRVCWIALSMMLLSPAAVLGQAAGPGQPEFDRGMALYRNHQCAAAIEPLEAANRSTLRPAALLALGYCYRQGGEFDKAIGAYQAYIQLLPAEGRGPSLLAQTKEEQAAWLRDHPAPAPPEVAAPRAVVKQQKPAARPKQQPPQVPAEVIANPGEPPKKSGIGWPVWVGAGAAAVGAGILTGMLISKHGGNEQAVTFNGR